MRVLAARPQRRYANVDIDRPPERTVELQPAVNSASVAGVELIALPFRPFADIPFPEGEFVSETNDKVREERP